MRFRTTILQNDKTATGIRIPDEVMEAMAAGRRPPVTVTINGYTYRSTVATVDGAPMVGLSALNREGAGVAGGDEVDVDIELDTQPRTVSLPDDFAVALSADPAAQATFDKLSNSNKGYHVSSIEGAKTAETRERRIARSVATLHEGKPR
ncbi:MAG TPA: YdeI/OmpD-associated family protein [Candidatus Limnocylindria bacterium]|nr:YdeI/OmpD-associated family protein [Candidatus Limnocylindria bacterium]